MKRKNSRRNNNRQQFQKLMPRALDKMYPFASHRCTCRPKEDERQRRWARQPETAKKDQNSLRYSYHLTNGIRTIKWCHLMRCWSKKRMANCWSFVSHYVVNCCCWRSLCFSRNDRYCGHLCFLLRAFYRCGVSHLRPLFCVVRLCSRVDMDA